MIGYKDAEQKVLKSFSNATVFSSVDLDEEYVFVLALSGDADNYHETRMSVDKKTGKVSDFFPRDIKRYNNTCKTRMIKKPAIAAPILKR